MDLEIDPENVENIPQIESAMNKTDCEYMNEGFHWRPTKLSVMCSYQDIRIMRYSLKPGTITGLKPALITWINKYPNSHAFRSNFVSDFKVNTYRGKVKFSPGFTLIFSQKTFCKVIDSSIFLLKC